MKNKYRTKKQLIQKIKEKGKIPDDKDIENFIEACLPNLIQMDLNEMIDEFEEKLPEEFYQMLWTIMRDSAIANWTIKEKLCSNEKH